MRFLRGKRYIVDEFRRLWNYPTSQFNVASQTWTDRRGPHDQPTREKLEYATRLFENYHHAMHAKWLTRKDCVHNYVHGNPDKIVDRLTKLGYYIDSNNRHMCYPPVKSLARPYSPKTDDEARDVLRLLRYWRFRIEQRLLPPEENEELNLLISETRAVPMGNPVVEPPGIPEPERRPQNRAIRNSVVLADNTRRGYAIAAPRAVNRRGEPVHNALNRRRAQFVGEILQPPLTADATTRLNRALARRPTRRATPRLGR